MGIFAREAKPIHRQRPLSGFRRYFGIHYFFSGLVVALAIFSQWFSMMRLETHAHTTHVSVAIREGFWWFLISEAFFFVLIFTTLWLPILRLGAFLILAYILWMPGEFH